MVPAILATAFVQAIRKKFCYAQKHFIDMLQTRDHCSLQIERILRGLMLFLLTPLPRVLHCKTVMAVGPHSLRPCFLYQSSCIVETFCGCSEGWLSADCMFDFPTW